jgi:hypothetical protein
MNTACLELLRQTGRVYKDRKLAMSNPKIFLKNQNFLFTVDTLKTAVHAASKIFLIHRKYLHGINTLLRK